MVKKHEGYFLEDGRFISNGGELKLPVKRWTIIHTLEDEETAREDMTTSITTITFEIEEKLLQEAEQVLKEIGMDMTCAVNLFLQAVIREKRIPFDY